MFFIFGRSTRSTRLRDQFLLCDNVREDRQLLFATQASLSFLENSEHWFMEGTFSTPPLKFAHLYAIHGLSDERNIVGAYGLLYCS